VTIAGHAPLPAQLAAAVAMPVLASHDCDRQLTLAPTKPAHCATLDPSQTVAVQGSAPTAAGVQAPCFATPTIAAQ
jgi:hypothetical protein